MLALYVALRRKLVDYAQSIVRDRALAEDVVQDAWLPLATLAEGRVLEEPVGYLWPRRRTSPVEHQIAEMEVEAVPPLSTPIRSAAE